MAGYGLIGEKLGHSYSAIIHGMLGAYDYQLIPLEKSELDAFMKKRDFKGLNVTIPYKKTVMGYCDRVSPLAEKLGAVNTLYFDEDGALCGTNTDYPGFLKVASSAGISFQGKKVLVLGDGGAGGMVRHAVKDSGAASVIVASRKPETSPAKDGFEVVSYEDLPSQTDAQVIVNSTPVGMYPDTGKSLITLSDFPDCEGVFDVIYNPYYTELLLQAKKAGIPHANGLSMLVSQATEAAAYFTGTPGWDEKDQDILAALRKESENIVLIGMPGSGKTTIGKKLAQMTGKTFVDMDEEIEKNADMSIPDIFEKYGEPHFRDLESRAAESLGKESSLIIATGGGVILRENNMDALTQNGRIVLLKKDIDKLATDGRPLSTDMYALKKMQETRGPLYEKYGEFSLDVTPRGPDENAKIIADLL